VARPWNNELAKFIKFWEGEGRQFAPEIRRARADLGDKKIQKIFSGERFEGFLMKLCWSKCKRNSNGIFCCYLIRKIIVLRKVDAAENKNAVAQEEM
jgi:hypothetical protein